MSTTPTKEFQTNFNIMMNAVHRLGDERMDVVIRERVFVNVTKAKAVEILCMVGGVHIHEAILMIFTDSKNVH